MNGAPRGPEKVDPNRLVDYLNDPGYRQWALAEVEKPDFWENNFISTNLPIAAIVIKMNPSRSLGSNAISGNIEGNNISDTDKNYTAVGKMTCWNQYKQQS